jgi:DNA-binding transcriptional MocR family regulator
MLVLLTKAKPDTLDLGKYSPSMDRLADQTGLKRDSVDKYIRLLEEQGWLAVRRHARVGNQYVLSEGKPFRATPAKGARPESSRPANGSTPRPVKVPSRPTNGSTPRPTNGPHTDLDRRSDRSDREPDPERCGDWRDDLQPWAPIRYG